MTERSPWWSARRLGVAHGGGRTLAALGVAALLVRWASEPGRINTPGRGWVPLATVVVAVAVAWSLPVMRRLLPRPGDVPLVLCGVLLTMFLCVPETDQILVIAVVVGAATIGAALAGRRWPVPVVAAGAAWIGWAGLFGAAGRQSAFVGVAMAWWPLLLPAVLTVWRPALAEAPMAARGAVVATAWMASVGVARTGALSPTIGPALVAVAIAVPVSAVATALYVARITPRPPHAL